MRAKTVNSFQEASAILRDAPAAYLDVRGKEVENFNVVMPVGVHELLEVVRKNIFSSGHRPAMDISDSEPMAVIGPMREVSHQLSVILRDDFWGCKPYYDRETLCAGILLNPQYPLCAQTIKVPILQIVFDNQESSVSSINLTPQAGWAKDRCCDVASLVGYWFARTCLPKNPDAITLHKFVDCVNYDIRHLDEYGIGPGMSGLLLHGRKPLLLWAELDNVLEHSISELNKKGILAAGAMHYPPRGHFRAVPADGFDLLVCPLAADDVFWGKIPPAAGRSRRIRLLDLIVSDEVDEGPQYLQRVQLSDNWRLDEQMQDTSLAYAVRLVWRSLLLRVKSQIDAIEVINRTIQVLGSDGVSQFVQAMQLLSVNKALQDRSDGESLAASWAAAFAAAQDLLEDMPQDDKVI